ncbi:Clp protease ClpP [Limosilactobacillus fermentum]|nr:head maturation protease, ClpP-related [Limosilactobacillus fermentum]MBC9021186.1 Clp protease ClpP [Limosilactobacillus fermentum CECT 5716]MCB4715006.1 Clp protease ClpP [Limosilactobacillus fermentum]MCH5396621.1 Clp protease ClpP [Limosilactobacillus fermentum]
MNKLPKYLTIKQQVGNKEADLFIDGEIVSGEFYDNDTSAAGFRDSLKQLGDVETINLHINSPGGSVFEGIAIYNMLKNNPAQINVYVDALAASIASVIAMSGDNIFMPSNSMLMIHNPWTIAMGNANDLRKQANDLDRIGELSVTTYLDKAGSKLDADTLHQLMDDETWLTAQEAVNYGLATEVIDDNQMAACADPGFLKQFRNVPTQLAQRLAQSATNDPAKEWREGIRKQALNKATALTIELQNMEES